MIDLSGNLLIAQPLYCSIYLYFDCFYRKYVVYDPILFKFLFQLFWGSFKEAH